MSTANNFRLLSRLGAIISILKNLLDVNVSLRPVNYFVSGWDGSTTKTLTNKEANYVYLIRMGQIRLVADANAANRYFLVHKYDANGNKVWTAMSHLTIASETSYNNFASGMIYSKFAYIAGTISGCHMGVPPNFCLYEGEYLEFVMENEQAGDLASIAVQYTKVKLQ